jgi:hypothetical protein
MFLKGATIRSSSEGRISEATAFCGERPWSTGPPGDRTLPDWTCQAPAERATMLKHPGQSLVAATPRQEIRARPLRRRKRNRQCPASRTK